MSETGRTRGQILRAAAAGGAVVGAGAVLGGWVNPQSSAGRPSRAQDAQIFNFLLLLEQAQAAFYDAALRGGGLRGDVLKYAQVVAPQEHDHVNLLRQRLGAQARSAPEFDFRAATSNEANFVRSAIDLEEAAAAAYIGQGASLTRPAVQDAARIVAVEARHAAWIRDLAGDDPAPHAADPGRSPKEILSDLRTKGYLQ
jgi:ferritin-like protein